MDAGARNISGELHQQLLEAQQTFSRLQISSADGHCTTLLRLQAATGEKLLDQLCHV